MSAGPEITYGCVWIRPSIRPATTSGIAPSSRRRSIRLTPPRPKSAVARSIVTTMTRSSPVGSGPDPARIPVTVSVDFAGSNGPRTVSVDPSDSPSWWASNSLMSAPAAPMPRVSPCTTTWGWTRGSSSGSIPSTVTGGRSAGPEPIGDCRYVRRSTCGAATATPGTPATACCVAVFRPTSSKALTRTSAFPRTVVTVRVTDASMAAFSESAAKSTPTPRPMPAIVRADRRRRAARLRQARDDRRPTAIPYRPSCARRAISSVAL